MKAAGILIMMSFLVNSYTANSQTTTDSLPVAKEEIIDWLNKKFALYTLKNRDFPGTKMESIKFDGCNMYLSNVFLSPLDKVGDININVGSISTIEYFSMSGGMIFFNYTDGMAFINFNISKEPDLLDQIRAAVNYLKTNCPGN